MALRALPIAGLVLSLLCSIILAAPPIKPLYGAVQSQKRNTRDNPTPVTADITGWEDIADQKVLHAGDNAHNYRDSGASFRPFHDDELERRDTAQITPKTISAEEWPPEHTVQGGAGASSFPATELQ
ncbi:hypothetical protein IQ07DRAFT_650672 [Pyrenochaeta sp. DS3sAY3a]|nr:hypothetical protein IQ07DRAFT_650672 [Pyrenochaeta sp. DS3sAY3a]